MAARLCRPLENRDRRPRQGQAKKQRKLAAHGSQPDISLQIRTQRLQGHPEESEEECVSECICSPQQEMCLPQRG